MLAGSHLVAVPLNCDPATARPAEGAVVVQCGAYRYGQSTRNKHHFKLGLLDTMQESDMNNRPSLAVAAVLWKTDLGMRDTSASAICTLSTLQLRPVIRQSHQMTLSCVSSAVQDATPWRPCSGLSACRSSASTAGSPVQNPYSYICIISCGLVISTWAIMPMIQRSRGRLVLLWQPTPHLSARAGTCER